MVLVVLLVRAVGFIAHVLAWPFVRLEEWSFDWRRRHEPGFEELLRRLHELDEPQ